jgi:hypothetical protein
LFAIGRILLREEPMTMLLISQIWNCRTSESVEDLTSDAPQDYRWKYEVKIPRKDAERVREVLWKAVKRMRSRPEPEEENRALQVTTELVNCWETICVEL